MTYPPGYTVTGTTEDPAFFHALPFITAAAVMAYRVDRAKTQLGSLPKLTSPTNYATARNIADGLQPTALLTVANGNAFIAAVAAAKALLP